MDPFCLLPSGFSEKWFQLSGNDLLCLWLTHRSFLFQHSSWTEEKSPVDFIQLITILKASATVEFHMLNNRREGSCSPWQKPITNLQVEQRQDNSINTILSGKFSACIFLISIYLWYLPNKNLTYLRAMSTFFNSKSWQGIILFHKLSKESYAKTATPKSHSNYHFHGE